MELGNGRWLSRFVGRLVASEGAPPLLWRMWAADEYFAAESSPFVYSPLVTSTGRVLPLPVRLSEPRAPDLFDVVSSNIWVSPVLRLLELVEDVKPLLLGALSLACFARSLDCFLLRPCNRLMMISRIRGRNLSKLAELASWLSVSSRIARSSSGTGPRSEVSTPIPLKARQAMLNSYPRRT